MWSGNYQELRRPGDGDPADRGASRVTSATREVPLGSIQAEHCQSVKVAGGFGTLADQRLHQGIKSQGVV
jgi:hypothetical protein